MAIIGVESLVYGVSNQADSVRFFDDFGLVRDPAGSAPGETIYRLPEGSRVIVRDRDDLSFATSEVSGDGVHEVVWGVSDDDARDRLAENLSRDREITTDADGTIHFVTDFGVAMGLRTFRRTPIVSATDPVNAPGSINRFNQPRRWRLRAIPKQINHVVFASPDYQAGQAFMRDRLGFRLSDIQRGFGTYLRADGSNAHHNLLLLNANSSMPTVDGHLTFNHANFGVEDIDEIMTGANYMARRGWESSTWGLGRHRIDSALFYYLTCPAGGEAEYGADSDVIDDGWIPRYWESPLFGFAHFVSNIPPFFMDAPEWSFRYITASDFPLDADPPDGGGH